MYRQSEKKLVKQQYLLHMSLQYGELHPTNGWDWFVSLGHPRKFQYISHTGIITALMSLTGGQPLNFAWCSAVSWAGTPYIHFWGLLPQWNFARCKIRLASKSCILLYWQRYCTALQQRASAKLCGVVQGMELQNFHRGCHLHLAGRPSRWASAHILVFTFSDW